MYVMDMQVSVTRLTQATHTSFCVAVYTTPVDLSVKHVVQDSYRNLGDQQQQAIKMPANVSVKNMLIFVLNIIR